MGKKLMMLPALSFLIISFVILRDLFKYKYKSILNPFFWLSLYSIFYFILPSFFVEEISYYYGWGIDDDSILFSHLIILAFISTVSVVYFFCASEFDFTDDIGFHEKCGTITRLLWWVVFSYLLFVLFKTFQTFELLDAFKYDGTQEDPFKIKNVAYLSIALTVIYFFDTRKYWVFLPNIIIIVIDLLNGSRTTAFIALAPVFICICCHRKALLLVPGIILVACMLLLGIIRSENVVRQIPWYLEALGEFRETYITLPLLILDTNYLGKGNFFDFMSAIGIVLLHPAREALSESFTMAGIEIYHQVSRGYGLASNIITESLFYGYFSFFVISLSCVIFCALFYWISSNAKNILIVVVVSTLNFIFLRIFVREGFAVGFGLFLFISLCYVLPVLILNRYAIKNRCNFNEV